MSISHFDVTISVQRHNESRSDGRRGHHVVGLIVSPFLALPAAVGRWLKRRHTRQVLAALDEHQLRDIGLTRAEISKL